VVKEIFERRAQEINDQDVMKALLTEVVDIWNARAADKDFVSSVLISKLGGIALARFLVG
jgi:S-adenosylmethionine/arginine decarboxylase-like enzyme